jgi:hypothetical protein
MSQSAVIDRHPYQLDAQAGKGKKNALGFPEGVNQERGEEMLAAWSTLVERFLVLRSSRKKIRVVPTGNWADGWSATANLREAAASSPDLTVTEKMAHPHAVVARLCSQEQFEVITKLFEDTFDFIDVEVRRGIVWMDPKWACEVISPSCFPPDSPEHELWLEGLPQCKPDGSEEKEAWRANLLAKAPQCKPDGSEEKEAWRANLLAKAPQCQLDGSEAKEGWLVKNPQCKPDGSKEKEAWRDKKVAGCKPGAKNKGKFKGKRVGLCVGQAVGQAVGKGTSTYQRERNMKETPAEKNKREQVIIKCPHCLRIRPRARADVATFFRGSGKRTHFQPRAFSPRLKMRLFLRSQGKM